MNSEIVSILLKTCRYTRRRFLIPAAALGVMLLGGERLHGQAPDENPIPRDPGTGLTVAAQEQLLVQSAVTTRPVEGLPSIENIPADANTTMAAMSAEPKPTPSQNVTINLIHRLVQRGVLTQADADELIKQAEEDASTARLAATRTQTEQKPRPDDGDPSLFPVEPAPLPRTNSTQATVSAASNSSDALASADEDTVHVHYVPDMVKEQLRDEIKQEVMQEAKDENWAAPRSFPSWAARFTPFADIRLRYEGMFFPDGNDDTGAFPNFNAINTGAPFDVSKISNPSFPPELNVNQDRERIRIRARAGALMDLDDGFTMGLRIATGESNTPTSTNQTLGAANNAQGGNFSKYAIWLDRAFVRWETGGTPSFDLQANLGRFDNPFFSPSEIVWDEDLGWDGIAISGKYKIYEGVTPFAAAGAFPVFNTDLNFSSNRPDKFGSEDKYLFGGQLGTNLRFNEDFSAKIAGAFYDFENIEGKLSSPFTPLTSSDQGNTDDSRPSFAQKGNTYFPIRDILPTADNGFGTTKLFEYFGLATPYREADFSGSVDYSHFDPFHLKLFGEYVQNVAFDINPRFVNNRGPDLPGGVPGNFAGGNTGWIVGLKAGSPTFEKRWDWFVGVSYRYVESDAMPDAFTDSDFGGGGTNLKGYSVFGGLALSSHVNLYLRWMSADEVAGPTLRSDILQFDLNAKF